MLPGEDQAHPCWAGAPGSAGRWGDPLAAGVWPEQGAACPGWPWQCCGPRWDAATWPPAVSLLRLLPELPAKPEGTGSDRREEISRAVSQGARQAHGGLCHHLGPQPVPRAPAWAGWPVVPGREVQTWGGGSRAAALPFPSRARESLTTAPQLLGRGARCKQTSFSRPAPRALSCLAAAACPVGAGRPRDSHMPPWTVSPVAWGQSLGQDLGQGTPEGSSGELMGIHGYRKKYLAIARRVVWGCAQLS